MKKYVAVFRSHYQVDLVVAAAGIIESTASNGSNMGDYMNECIDVNVKGVMNTIIPFIPQMKVFSIRLIITSRRMGVVNFV